MGLALIAFIIYEVKQKKKSLCLRRAKRLLIREDKETETRITEGPVEHMETERPIIRETVLGTHPDQVL